MPELTNNKVGSLLGIKLEERTMLWPLDSKNLRNLSRISDEFIGSVSVKVRAKREFNR
jgi:hypothetical protein